MNNTRWLLEGSYEGPHGKRYQFRSAEEIAPGFYDHLEVSARYFWGEKIMDKTAYVLRTYHWDDSKKEWKYSASSVSVNEETMVNASRDPETALGLCREFLGMNPDTGEYYE
jgi:hypothetical protein